eukprot:6082610-Alexandrium_andersonii.AAC.1
MEPVQDQAAGVCGDGVFVRAGPERSSCKYSFKLQAPARAEGSAARGHLPVARPGQAPAA